ncbi:hypothetical protein HNY73_021185 [Argiope bruennichi]|uniref:Uncharacterized protein n=1 Tax=Argiope bruennichi TaxID=94029 RepID=A0A8T0EA39_ARGBR|nr:hypothetical protein HNY73_021185 [Argiope bruennichi]
MQIISKVVKDSQDERKGANSPGTLLLDQNSHTLNGSAKRISHSPRAKRHHTPCSSIVSKKEKSSTLKLSRRVHSSICRQSALRHRYYAREEQTPLIVTDRAHKGFKTPSGEYRIPS